MARFKAWNASNSMAIAKFHNAESGHFGHNTFIHELIRGSLNWRGETEFRYQDIRVKPQAGKLILFLPSGPMNIGVKPCRPV